jgi:hypothetical protein
MDKNNFIMTEISVKRPSTRRSQVSPEPDKVSIPDSEVKYATTINSEITDNNLTIAR